MSYRRQRTAQEVRASLAEIVERHARDPRLGLVTIVDVEMSPDLSFARVYYRTLGDPEETHRALAKAKPFIRRRLAEASKRKRVPELDFRLDRSFEGGARVDRILREVEEESPTAAPETEPEPPNREEPA